MNLTRTLAKALSVAAIFATVFFWSAPDGSAQPEYSRKTGKECSFCHPAGSFNLTRAGEYYRDHKHSLRGWVPPPAPLKRESKQGKD